MKIDFDHHHFVFKSVLCAAFRTASKQVNKTITRMPDSISESSFSESSGVRLSRLFFGAQLSVLAPGFEEVC
jgi:hypothetical protein